MTTENIGYWGFRINTDNQTFFRDELKQGRLRQGWGWPGQDLRGDSAALHPSARPNLRMFNEVKKGHILLVPRLPEWHLVAIVEASEDWNSGYRFDVAPKWGDYGHIFPAKQIGQFSREAAAVTGDLHRSLGYRRRFWNMRPYAAAIDALRNQDDSADSISDAQRLDISIQGAFTDAFDNDTFGQSVYDRLNNQFENARWEDVLVQVLKKTRYPDPCVVTKVGGGKESCHGTDILISLPQLSPDDQFPTSVIAVQVKDWSGNVSDKPIYQIEKASWWEEKEGHRVIEKVVIITQATRKENPDLVRSGQDRNVRLVFADELKALLTDYAKLAIGFS